LIIERSGPNDEVIKCLMPLTIRSSELNEGLEILERALAKEFHGNRSGPLLRENLEIERRNAQLGAGKLSTIFDGP